MPACCVQQGRYNSQTASHSLVSLLDACCSFTGFSCTAPKGLAMWVRQVQTACSMLNGLAAAEGLHALLLAIEPARTVPCFVLPL